MQNWQGTLPEWFVESKTKYMVLTPDAKIMNNKNIIRKDRTRKHKRISKTLLQKYSP